MWIITRLNVKGQTEYYTNDGGWSTDEDDAMWFTDEQYCTYVADLVGGTKKDA